MSDAPAVSPTGLTRALAPAAPADLAGDTIRLVGVRGYGHHGVFEHERRDGQEFVVDVVCRIDLAAAAATDDLARTVDYGELAGELTAGIQDAPVDLIETLAERMAGLCLAHPGVSAVEVTVHKPQAPMPVPVADVSVTILRKRSS